MNNSLIDQFEALSRLVAAPHSNKWARNGNWWYYLDSTTGHLMRVPVRNQTEWDLSDQAKQNLSESAKPIWDSHAYSDQQLISHDISGDGHYICLAMRSTRMSGIELSVIDIASGEVLASRCLYNYRVDRVFLSYTGSAIYFTCPSSHNNNKSLWAIQTDQLRGSSPRCLFKDTKASSTSIKRTASHRFLKVVIAYREKRKFLFFDLNSTKLQPGIQVGFGSLSNHYTVEHLNARGKDLALIIEHADNPSHDRIKCLSLKDRSVIRLIHHCNNQQQLLLSSASSLYVAQHNIIGFFRDGLAVRIGVFSYAYDGSDTVHLEQEDTFDIPSYIDATLLHPIDWRQPYIDVMVSSLVAAPRLLRITFEQHGRKCKVFPSRPQDTLATMGRNGYGTVRTFPTLHDGSCAAVTVASSATLSHPSRGCLVIGYGAYGRSLPRTFSPLYALLLEHGVDVVIAHVRGGGEFGFEWHRQGTKLHKRESINDYIDVCEYIKAKGTALYPAYKLIALGSSAGGLLVASAANQTPEIFDGLVLIAPFLSPLRSLMDPADPLVLSDWREFGNPNLYSDIKDYIASYSPLENIPHAKMPDCFVAINELDSRVNNHHTFEWCDRIRNTGAELEIEIRPGANHAGIWHGSTSSQIRLLEWILNRVA